MNPNFLSFVQPPVSVIATGGGADLDISAFDNFLDFTLASLNTAGTSPTLAAKLQHAIVDVAGAGPQYLTAGAVDNTLKAGASTTVKLAAKFTSDSVAKALKSVRLQLKKIGTIAAAQTVTVEILADSSGPSGSALGTATIDIDSKVGAAYSMVQAVFTNPVDLAASTVYWIVLSASYTASASNAVTWRTNTVASAGNFATWNATIWTLVATSSGEFFIERQYLAFVDVAGATAAGATTGASILNKIKAYQGDLNQIVRWYFTIGGTSSPAYAVQGIVAGPQKTNP